MIDLLGAVSLGAISALVVVFYIGLLPWSPARRAALAGAFAVWFALVVACGATGAFDAVRGTGPAGLGIAVMAPIVVLSYVGMRAGGFRDALAAIPLPALIGIQAIRLLGIFFVLLYWGGRLPAPF